MFLSLAISPPPGPINRPITRPITLTAVGDVMLGSDFPTGKTLPPQPADLLREVAPILRKADLAFGNLEGPLATGGSTAKRGKNSYVFRSPPAYADVLAGAGFDIFSLANNHASDFGAAGRASTRAALARAGIGFVGLAGEITERRVRNVPIAFVAFAHNPISDNVNDIAGARRLVARAVARAKIVVVSFHGGAEGIAASRVPSGTERYLGEARGDLRRFSHAVVDAGADLVLGHGPHVPRAMELYKGRLIAYSLGNFATYGLFNLRGSNGLAPLLWARLDPSSGRFVGGRIVSARQRGQGGPRLDRAGGAATEIRRLSKLDFPATGIRVAADGALSR